MLFLLLTSVISVYAGKTYSQTAVLNLNMKDNTVKEVIQNNESIGQQQLSVSGTVTDQSGEPLIGVTIVVKGTTQGAITDSDGNYLLQDVPDDATLVFSFVGMQTQEIQVAGKTSISIIMEESTIELDEVIAIGYGTMKKSDLTGSVGSISSEDLGDRIATDIGHQMVYSRYMYLIILDMLELMILCIQ